MGACWEKLVLGIEGFTVAKGLDRCCTYRSHRDGDGREGGDGGGGAWGRGSQMWWWERRGCTGSGGARGIAWCMDGWREEEDEVASVGVRVVRVRVRAVVCRVYGHGHGTGRAFCFLQLQHGQQKGIAPHQTANQPLASLFTQNSELFFTSRPLRTPSLLPPSCPSLAFSSRQLLSFRCPSPSMPMPMPMAIHYTEPPRAAVRCRRQLQ